MLHSSSFFAVCGPTPGMVIVPVKLGMSCMGVAWNLVLTLDTVTPAGSVLLAILETVQSVVSVALVIYSVAYI